MPDFPIILLIVGVLVVGGLAYLALRKRGPSGGSHSTGSDIDSQER